MHRRASAYILCLVIVLSPRQVRGVQDAHLFPAFTELLLFGCQNCKQPMAGSAVSAATEEIKGTAAVHGSKYRSGLRTASSGESVILAEIGRMMRY